MKLDVRGGSGPVDPKPPRTPYSDLIEAALLLGSYGTKHIYLPAPAGERERSAKLRAYRRVLRVYVNPNRERPLWVRLTEHNGFIVEEKP